MDLPREHGLGIVAEIDGKVVGIIGISRFQPSSMRHVVAFSLATDVEYQNKGVGSQLMKTAIKYSFDYINAMRIEIDVAADNEIAQHLYEKFGFEHEGSKRKAAFKDGRYIDTKIMSLINDKLIGSDP